MKVLGWDPVKKEGLFTNNFDSLDDGKTFAKNLADEGADIVVPVAGPVGQGSAALATEMGPDKLKIIGVDVDQYLTDPEHKGVFLTSILKRMDSTTVAAIKEAVDGSFKGGVIVGTLANGGVGLAPFHDLDRRCPPISRRNSTRSRPASRTARSTSRPTCSPRATGRHHESAAPSLAGRRGGSQERRGAGAAPAKGKGDNGMRGRSSIGH